ncbi:cytochrome c family protein [Geobacter pelophilus]|uniref:Cytochrome c family protein n=1 Tax=Geoanaerobacter pelophilus TaxID=60036 RepID=A0AAW4L907_9BACT|nr:cytochrome c family protein [Geoanaerobacter pelophilus]MBT0665050.1 cytochrome c family protein [Geoanaerobacter pelophilus]
MRSTCHLLTILALLILASQAFGAQAPTVFDFDREFYPYYPSLIKWNKSTAAFTPPETCRDCHPKQYKEWSGSVHNLAFHDPIYQGELNKAVKAVGHEISRQCEGCHSPAGMVTGEIKGPGISGLSPVASSGVSCDICHSISGVTHWQTPAHEPENGSMILTPGVDGKEGPTLIKRGPFKPADNCGGGFHDCAESTLHLRADLCASCHQVFHYDRHFPLEATYREWKSGAYAQNQILCQDCHMVDIQTFKKVADSFYKPLRSEYQHSFNGANYLLYYLAAAAANKAGNISEAAALKKKYEMAVERLKLAADLDIAPLYREGKLAEIKVTVKNLRAGHDLPTSLTNIRQMWLEISARDEKGNIVLQSGSIKADGALPENTRLFNSDGMGSNFHFAVDPWVVTSFSRHDTIPPKGSRIVYYGLPYNLATKNIALEVKLRYRQADQKVAESLLSAVPKDINLKEIYGLDTIPPLPVVDMVIKHATLPTEL